MNPHLPPLVPDDPEDWTARALCASWLAAREAAAERRGAEWLQPEPPEHVLAVLDYTADAAPIDDSPQWGRTTSGEWKGYKDGGKEYLDWPELCRRWGPLTWAARLDRDGEA